MVGNGVDEPDAVTAFGRRPLLAVDAKGYGGVDAETQRQFQQAIVGLLDSAAAKAGLDRAAWETQEGGDSLFAVLPADTSEPALVDDFMRALDAGLRAFNFNLGEGRRPWLRLRAVVHFGAVALGANGFVGRAPVETGRILDCAPLRAALDTAPYACLAVALSSTVFHEVVEEGYTTIPPEEFRRVDVEKKEHRGEAWIWLPGGDIRQLDLDPPPKKPAPGHAPGPGPYVGSLHSGDGSAIVVGNGGNASVTNGTGGAPSPGPESAGEQR
ncbi:hypothetical protein [Streptomyces caeruleatus]|uniref:Guanylate cyclase domain-containing protein n=1 Tax=Streptomyces caeruleatus TaxID=661399 RepID=A0A101TVN5_9ACTN|nr:hypothetical protein [Streptomyces caeruleatus]KUN99362.1 hypothetical protein AQJ67_25610 [Streptomyces caeruleatus]